mmetsp:Transcript_122440/g.305685  ORF Transcript_122440/g.305685 Transcript_122440/m.305685 type:complete len:247 (+) Transcript_122440:646-1386(+)
MPSATHARSKGRAPSAACWPPSPCNRLALRQPSGKSNMEWPRLCWKLIPVAARPGSAMHAITLSTPACWRRLLRPCMKRQSPALLRRYWSKALNLLTLVPLISGSLRFTAANGVNLAMLVCSAMRAWGDARSKGKSSWHNNACDKRFTCMIASKPSSVTSRSSPLAPPLPAFKHRTSKQSNMRRTCAANARTVSKEAKSMEVSSTMSLASGTSALMAFTAASASSWKPGRLGTITWKPSVASIFTA